MWDKRIFVQWVSYHIRWLVGLINWKNVDCRFGNICTKMVLLHIDIFCTCHHNRRSIHVSAPLLSSKFLHRKVGETFPILYPRAFISFRRYMMIMVLRSDWLSKIYSLSLEMRGISICSCNFHITGHPKYDTTNTE